MHKIPLDEARLVKLYQTGTSIRAMAKAYQCSSGTISRALKALGVMDRRGDKQRIPDSIRCEAIRRKNSEDISVNRLAREMGLSVSFVWRILEEHRKYGKYTVDTEAPSKVIVPFDPADLPSPSAIRLAQFDPVVRRALSLRISEMAETEIPATLAAILSTSDGVPSRGPPLRA